MISVSAGRGPQPWYNRKSFKKLVLDQRFSICSQEPLNFVLIMPIFARSKLVLHFGSHSFP